ncbi:MAG TPA: P-II family nitrogen regulator, partial [Tissierellaceae bacterium]|nr:P-II family nitrogen regulator [Tissierellaceae bacterium]
GKGSKALKLAKRLGAMGGTIFLGKGTVSNELLNVLGLLEIRKEIFITIIDEDLESNFYDEMSKKFSLEKPNTGVAFSIPLKRFLRISQPMDLSNTEKRDVNKVDYEAIFVIVDKGLSDNVLDSAKSAGSRGGTVIHGRGSGTKAKEKLFNIEIEPEKDIVLILAKEEEAKKIVDSIKEGLNICDPGAGIIFVLDVNRTLGLYSE